MGIFVNLKTLILKNIRMFIINEKVSQRSFLMCILLIEDEYLSSLQIIILSY